MKNAKRILLYAGAGVIGVIGVWVIPGLILLGGILLTSPCSDEVVQEVPFRQGTLELHQGNCGATTDFTYDLQWKQKNGESEELTAVDALYGALHFEVTNETGKTVHVTYTPGTTLEQKTVKRKGMTFAFKERQVSVKVPADFVKQKSDLRGKEVAFYTNYIDLYKQPDHTEHRLGYALDESGYHNPAYDEKWFNIGFVQANDNAVLSALYIQDEENGYPVYIETEHGKKMKIADSYENFESILRRIEALPYGKHYCDDPAKDRGLKKERDGLLAAIQQKNPNSSLSLWETFLPGKPFPKEGPCDF